MRWLTLAVTVAMIVSITFVASPTAATHDRRDGIPCVLEHTAPLIKGAFAVFPEESRVGIGDETTIPADERPPTAVLVYEETNGADGIQRDDPFEQDRHCGHGPDHLVAGAGCVVTLDVLRWNSLASLDIHGCVAELALPSA